MVDSIYDINCRFWKLICIKFGVKMCVKPIIQKSSFFINNKDFWMWAIIIASSRNVRVVDRSDKACLRGLALHQYYTIFLLFSPAVSDRIPWASTDFARDLQLVHHHFCILQKECGKLEGTKTKTKYLYYFSSTVLSISFGSMIFGPPHYWGLWLGPN